VYCQLGRTNNLQITRQQFYKPQEILDDVTRKIQAAKENEEAIDYLTFVPDGEPTLDISLGTEIQLLKNLSLAPKKTKIAVITNSSLIDRKDTQDDVSNADWVSLKIDVITQSIWRKINRPHGSLKYTNILQGIADFSHSFKGDLTTETMLVKGVNDQTQELEKITDFIQQLKPKKSYLSIPTRPPAETWVTPPSENQLNIAYQMFKEKDIDAECLIGYEGNTFGYTGNIEDDLLGITAVHPIRKDGVIKLLTKANRDWSVIEKLLYENKLMEVEYDDKKFYVRRFPKKTL
jgi:wyosine [tRNA(Phe)-imidazoG37] synthetase (radical SAM superfamily)